MSNRQCWISWGPAGQRTLPWMQSARDSRSITARPSRRMDSAGATLTTTEAALFQWCEVAGTPQFKDISVQRIGAGIVTAVVDCIVEVVDSCTAETKAFYLAKI